jgi:hypothetical protein
MEKMGKKVRLQISQISSVSLAPAFHAWSEAVQDCLTLAFKENAIPAFHSFSRCALQRAVDF